jgi:hypothetical protein
MTLHMVTAHDLAALVPPSPWPSMKLSSSGLYISTTSSPSWWPKAPLLEAVPSPALAMAAVAGGWDRFREAT